MVSNYSKTNWHYHSVNTRYSLAGVVVAGGGSGHKTTPVVVNISYSLVCPAIDTPHPTPQSNLDEVNNVIMVMTSYRK